MQSYLSRSITYNTKNINVITQNSNGPCPLIAIINTLALKGDLILPQAPSFSFDMLSSTLAEMLLLSPSECLEEVLDVIQNLQYGLDVNVHFDGIRSFEFTPAISLFDSFKINLNHGWICSVRSPAHDVVAKELKSYNKVVECIVKGDLNLIPPPTDVEVAKATICQDFLKLTSSQLTLSGLSEIQKSLPEDMPSVLFRNNHFYTILKRGAMLYTLCTDEGYADSDIVWESLDSITGESHFYDSDMVLYNPDLIREKRQDYNADLALALQLQDEENVVTEADHPSPASFRTSPSKKGQDQCIIS